MRNTLNTVEKMEPVQNESIQSHISGFTTNLGTFYPTELPTVEWKWAYLAGLFDGEGCVALTQTRSLSNPRLIRHYARVVVSNCYVPMLHWIRANFGGCVSVSNANREATGRKPSAMWISHKPSHSMQILNGMLPYLLYKHSEARIALTLFERLADQGSGSSDLIESRHRIDIVESIRNLPGRSQRSRRPKLQVE